ncbi:hypothetical protein NGB36_23190 [Streptomyces sp. RB6PN25]|uniref:Uncharacterized protein n=1 Tax=Streptomyces humicola TaxID=2953240 RepID=A0ABT1Q0G5_9ACTN|nr:hypothetical protein [Streptomyces humicola]MCQ4083430.1 hypothetical protein [Streptomyces humicola]
MQARAAGSLTGTVGTHALVLPDDERAALLARVREYLASRPETATGRFDLPIVTLAERMVLRPRVQAVKS